MKDFNIFKIEYDWYEGEHEEILIGKRVTVEEFEEDLAEAKRFAEGLRGKKVEGDYFGKGYSVECLPEFYEQILWYLTEKKEYVYCDYDHSTSYAVEDSDKKRISVIKTEKKTVRRMIKND